MEVVEVDLGERSYDIKIGAGVLGKAGSFLQELDIDSKILVITDSRVDELYSAELTASLEEAGFDVHKAVIDQGEEQKTLSTARELYDQAVEANLDRNSSIVALGGGVVGDIAGFIAATFMRGINFIQIPTTLLAQVDSSVGGKVAVNHSQGKNLIGNFYQPRLVLADPKVLATLEEREFKAGLAEVIKHGFIRDRDYFDFLVKEAEAILELEEEAIVRAVKRSCEIKAAVVAEDEREEGLRAILNYGHTIGHALEAATNYQVYRHGEAVAVGMVAAAEISHKLGYLSSKEVSEHRKVLNEFGLPISYRNLEASEIIPKLKQDKKVKAGKVRFILAKEIGDVFISSEVSEETTLKVVEKLKED